MIQVGTVGQRIILARVFAGMEQQELAKACGISRSYQSLIESNSRPCSLDMAKKFADKTGVSLNFITGKANRLEVPKVK